MGEAYPELVAERETIARWVGDEEESFGRTLERGSELLERLVAEAKESGTSWIDAADAFKLHDTYGFPYDLTKELLAEQGLSVDDGGFEELMEEQRQRARAGAATAHGSEDRHERVIAFAGAGAADPLRRLRDAADDDRPRRGARATTAAPWSSSRRAPSTPRAAARSPTPACCAGTAARRRSLDVYRVGDDQALEVEPAGEIDAGVAVEAEVDRETRHATMRNHTATHLLHAALRERLGTHVRQAGSAVRPDKLRFDFTHGQALGAEELRAVEDRVNEWIKASRPVRWLEMERAEAERLGAMALFGEKYGEWVRVVEVDGVSRELCGGTHVANTAEVGIFKIASEGSSAANVRRIEALSGPAAIDWFREREERLREVGELLGAPAGPARRRPPRRRAPARGRRRAPSRRRSSCSARRPSGWSARRPRSAASSWSSRAAPLADQKQLLDLANRVQSKLGGDSAVVLGGAEGDKVALVVLVSKGAVERGLSAAEIVREAAPVVGGGGGGRDDMAQAGGKDPAKLDEALATARGAIEREARVAQMRVLALDHGTARIGCAISDPSGTLSTPLPVIEPPEAARGRRARRQVRGRAGGRRPAASPERRGRQPGGPGPHLLRRTGGDPRRSGRDLRRAADDPHGRGEQARRRGRRARLARRRPPAPGLPRRPRRDRGARR